MSMKKEENQSINRRDFLKRLGVGVAATSIAVTGCKNKNNPVLKGYISKRDIPTDQMSYRIHPRMEIKYPY